MDQSERVKKGQKGVRKPTSQMSELGSSWYGSYKQGWQSLLSLRSSPWWSNHLQTNKLPFYHKMNYFK